MASFTGFHTQPAMNSTATSTDDIVTSLYQQWHCSDMGGDVIFGFC